MISDLQCENQFFVKRDMGVCMIDRPKMATFSPIMSRTSRNLLILAEKDVKSYNIRVCEKVVALG